MPVEMPDIAMFSENIMLPSEPFTPDAIGPYTRPDVVMPYVGPDIVMPDIVRSGVVKSGTVTP
jgi:hypothetical protein